MSNFIFYDGRLEKRAGGPSTYLYNLRNELFKIDKEKIGFIYDESTEINNKEKIIKNVIKNILKVFPILYEVLYMSERMKKDELFTVLKNRVKPGDIVMFHKTDDLARALEILPKDCTKLLMSHSPEVASKEIVTVLKARTNSKRHKFLYAEKKYFKKFDLVALQNTDILVFPSKEAMEPYYQTVENFDEIIRDKEIRYLPTGTEKLQFSISKSEFRKKYNIPKDAFVISFIGRHNYVKGYDNFVEIGKVLLNKYSDIYITTAGIGDIDSLENSRWIDIGWTNDPGSLANASDVFVLPNRRTYFDLILLEMLSIGKTCVVSNTGGNKTISKYSEGIIVYKDNKEAIYEIEELYNNKEKLKEFEKANIRAYNENFTLELFANRYLKFMEELERKNEKISN